MKPARIVIFCPNPYSLYTTTVCELLLRQGIEVPAIFVRQFTWRRLRSELTRDGRRLLKKIWNKLVLRERAYATTGRSSIMTVRNAHGIKTRQVSEFGASHAMSIIPCETLNDPHVEQKLRELSPDLIVFTGGGIIRQPILSAAGAGIINCHSGILPEYRGMDVVEWALLQGDFNKVGCTAHFMDTGLDTGDILKTDFVQPEPGESIQALRQRIEGRMVEVIVASVIEFLDGKIKRQPQRLADGRQYFVMHPALRTVAEQRLKAGVPAVST